MADQSEQIQLRQARSKEEDYMKMFHFLEELEELMSEATDEEIIAHLQKGFDSNVGNHYQRLIFGYEVLIKNCCDETLSYLEWKPEIKAAIERDQAICQWQQDEEGNLSTSCGHEFILYDRDENDDYQYCLFCGKKISFLSPQQDEE